MDLDSPLKTALRLVEGGDYEKAMCVVTLALFRSPRDPDLLALRAILFNKLKKPNEAILQWCHIEKVAPHAYTDIARLRHAEALIACKKFDEAEALLKAVSPHVQDDGLRGKLIARLLVAMERIDIGTVRLPSRVAGQITDSNEALANEYLELITNDQKNVANLRFRSLVIISYGRTGSTLLQGILNVIDGVRVLGENEGAFLGLYQFHSKIESLRRFKHSHSLPSSPFFGSSKIDKKALDQKLKDVITAYFEPFAREDGVHCIGFKDVQISRCADEIVCYLEFLETMLPLPAFIFLWRQHDAVLRSGFWKLQDRNRAKKTLEKMESEAAKFAQGRRNCFTVDYTDLNPDAPNLRDLVSFLGGTFDRSRISRVIDIPHSYDPEQSHIRRLFDDAQTNS